MRRKIPPLKSLRAFEAAGRHLSFTRAADELFVTQAAVSHQIKALEEFLGIQLFIRRNRKLLLTDEGQNYWPRIRDIFESLTVATEQVRATVAGGSLTISVIPSFATAWLIPRLMKFNKIHPDIDVRLKASDERVDFLQEDVDIAIYYEKGDNPGMHSVTLMNEHYTPLCAPSLLLDDERPEGQKALSKPEDLRFHTLLHDYDTSEWQRWLRHNGVKGIDLSSGPIFSHSSMVQQAAAYGQGIAMGHLVLSQPDIAAGRLVQPFPYKLESEYSYDLVCPMEYAKRPKVKAFADWIVGVID